MAGSVVKVEGLEELKRALRELPLNLRKRALRDAMRAGGRVVQKAMRDAAPVLDPSDRAVLKGYRRPGTMRKAISVRTSRISTSQGNVGVFVNVKPAKGAKYKTTTTRALGFKIKKRQLVRASQRGAKNPNDPFYWRFVNFKQGAAFLEAGAAKLGDALPAIVARIGPAIQKLNVKGGKA
jgi:HK97 gp10 family phage protein